MNEENENAEYLDYFVYNVINVKIIAMKNSVIAQNRAMKLKRKPYIAVSRKHREIYICIHRGNVNDFNTYKYICIHISIYIYEDFPGKLALTTT